MNNEYDPNNDPYFDTFGDDDEDVIDDDFDPVDYDDFDDYCNDHPEPVGFTSTY